ncbi:hypothetical protein [Reyranella sp.]|uniref:hypothetical protein n=1 Tax=Reyranella sp. TaxID=1929291 RepID=UPI003C7E4F4A
MASIMTDGLLSAAPAADPWPRHELGDDSALGLQADEMFARQLDTRFAGEVRGLVTDPTTGLAGKDPEEALAGIGETTRLLGELKDSYLAQAIGPRQKALLEPVIDRRLDRASDDLGRIAEQATSVLDDRIVAERLADLARDASLSWQDPAHLRTLGRTTVGELRYQGERKGWDAGRTDTAVRTGLSDLYAGAVEAAIDQDPERAAKLYDHARDVIQPERQAAVERRIERAREERRVTEIVGGLSDTPDDPTRRPDLDDYQARAAELTPPDASPEVRAQVTRMARIEQARADRAWQATRGRAAASALDWLGENPAAPLMAMPTALRDGLSPEQMEALDRTAMNGGRVVTDRDLYDKLDDLAVRTPEDFAGLDLTQHRLSLGDSDYNRLTKLQQALAEGKSDPAFERHRLGRLFLDEGLRTANLDPEGEEAKTARQQLDRLLGAFESVEGKPPKMVDIRGLVGDVLPRGEGDPNTVRTSGSEPVEASGNTEIAPLQQPIDSSRQVAPPTKPVPRTPEYTAKGAFDGTEPRVVHNDDGSAEVTAGKIPTPGGPAEATIHIDRDRSGASSEMVLPNGHRVESRRTNSNGGIWSQIDTIRDPQGTVVGTQTTTFDGTRVTQTWEPTDGPAQTASWEAEPPSGDVHLANAGIGALGGLGSAGSLAADSLTATAKAIAGDMLALGARALGLAGAAVTGAAAGVAAGAAVLLTPVNSQGTTVDLGDGVRLRQPPGGSSGVIEKSALGGSLWDRTPVAVHIRDGATSDRPRILTIDATALERAIGPEAADRVLAEAETRFDVVPIYSSRPLVKEGRRDGTGNSTAASPNSSPPEEPDFGEFEHIIDWLTKRDLRADKDKYKAADGTDTAIGVRLDPRVGEPAAGRDYQPDHPNHRKGLEGEFGLVNEFARQFPDHTIIEFGRKAGEHGPDVISVDPNGKITVLDSKWRGADTSISPSRRAHQTENSLQSALQRIGLSIDAAMKSGRVSPEAGATAMENWRNGNLTIVTVGTGNARNGVIERIAGDERAVVHPKRRP